MRRYMMIWTVALIAMAGRATAAEFSWSFDSLDLSPAKVTGGTVTLDHFDASTQAQTDFLVTSVVVPDFPDGTGAYVHHPPFSAGGGGGAGGYLMGYTNVPPNGGGAYLNDYTIMMDIYLPALDWTALFNTNPGHGNDADWYVAPDGSLGIGELGYSPSGTISAGRWHRLAFVQDQANNLTQYFVDGAKVFQSGAAGLDGRFSLYTSNDAPPQLVIHGEGDGSGNYSNEIYMGSLFFADFPLSEAEIVALGGASYEGIRIVPEPAGLMMGLLLGAGLLARRRR